MNPCADCLLIDRLAPDVRQWAPWQRWRARALVEALAADGGDIGGAVETGRDRAEHYPPAE